VANLDLNQLISFSATMSKDGSIVFPTDQYDSGQLIDWNIRLGQYTGNGETLHYQMSIPSDWAAGTYVITWLEDDT
jgi:hypothetical protein